ncbi:MAG: hypothetical protein FJ398_15485 [Verrucomicrobia bacterium]|nr:hypothetical protein [Verrucomicrobiota bacterium]
MPKVKATGQRDLVTVVGTMPSANAEESLTAEGRWIRDREFGLQFRADRLRERFCPNFRLDCVLLEEQAHVALNSTLNPVVQSNGRQKMKQVLAMAVLLSAVLVLGEDKPNFSGVWKYGSDFFKIEHREPKIHVLHEIDDQHGKRTLDMRALTDGKQQKFEAQGFPALSIGACLWESKAG